MRVLVTGTDGFVARHLVPYLCANGHAVIGTALDPHRVQGLGIPLEALDVTDAEACRRVLDVVEPTHIAHLAAVSSVRWSYDHPAETRRVNVEGTRNVLDAATDRLPAARILVVGSAEEYGPNDGQPLPELPRTRLRPLSPYAASKVDVEQLIEGESRYRAVAVRTRSFPHFGPGQRRGFFAADVASQLARATRTDEPTRLLVGNVDTTRDYTDVRDVVRAYALLLEHGLPGEVYNVCTGRGVRVRELLDLLIAAAGVRVQVERDTAKDRPSEIPALIGDNAKLRAATGWEPRIPLAQTVRDVLDWWKSESSSHAVGAGTASLTEEKVRRQ